MNEGEIAVSDSVSSEAVSSSERPLDMDRLRKALEGGNIPTLVLVLRHLTGDPRWLKAPYCPQRKKGLDDNDDGGLPSAIQAEIREAVLDAVLKVNRGDITPAEPTTDQVAEWLEESLVEEVPREYGPLLAEELGILSRDVEMGTPPEGFRVLVVGAGMSGLAAAVKLKTAGIDFTIIEKDPDVGGAWLENVYPGAGVDTPSHLYSFSFDPNNRWSRYFAKRNELWEYFVRVSERFGVREHIEFGTEVLKATYDEGAGQWQVVVRQGEVEETRHYNVFIPAVGMVNRPSIPPIPGLDKFQGVSLHTAAWDPTVEMTGKRVVVVGTGASSMQLVPSIVDQAEHVVILQRSKQWAIPHPNYQRTVSDDVHFLLDNVPFYNRWYRLRAFWNFSDRLHPSLQIDPDWEHPQRAINASNDRHREFLTKYIVSQLGDRSDLIEACVPDYPPYAKRALIDNGWFTTVTRDDVELLTGGVAEVTETGVVTTSGVKIDADILVFATGFKILQFLWPLEVLGRGGVSLHEQWGPEDARAYLGITVPNFPNMFILNGPNTNAGHGGSAVIAAEFQVRYMMQAIARLVDDGVASLEVRQEVFDRYQEQLDDALGHSIWVHGGTTTYHRNKSGRVVVSSPWKYIDYWRMTLKYKPVEYHEEAEVKALSA